MSGPKKIDRVFKAFADETRLRILHLLTRGELCVCDLVDTLRLPQPKVSRHLAYLRGAGLVRVRKAGLWKHYSLAEPSGEFHRSLISCLRSCFSEADALRRDLERFKKYDGRKSCE
jgi:ArsR family transcriptional regulator